MPVLGPSVRASTLEERSAAGADTGDAHEPRQVAATLVPCGRAVGPWPVASRVRHLVVARPWRAASVTGLPAALSTDRPSSGPTERGEGGSSRWCRDPVGPPPPSLSLTGASHALPGGELAALPPAVACARLACWWPPEDGGPRPGNARAGRAPLTQAAARGYGPPSRNWRRAVPGAPRPSRNCCRAAWGTAPVPKLGPAAPGAAPAVPKCRWQHRRSPQQPSVLWAPGPGVPK